MRTLSFLLGLVLAVAIHVLGTRWIPGFPSAVDLFLVLAVLNGLSAASGWSALGGSVGGLVRDALSGGLYGLHGFADTSTAWLVSRWQQRLVISKPLQIGLLLAVASAVQLAILLILQYLLVSDVKPASSPSPDFATGVVRLVSSGVLGVLFFVFSARARETLARRRERRRRRLTIAI